MCDFVCVCVKVSCWTRWNNLLVNLSFSLQECFFWIMCPMLFVFSWVNHSCWETVSVNLDHYLSDAIQGLSLEVVVFPAGSGACRNLFFAIPFCG